MIKVKKVIIQTKAQEIQDGYVIPCDTSELIVSGAYCVIPDFEVVLEQEMEEIKSCDFLEF